MRTTTLNQLTNPQKNYNTNPRFLGNEFGSEESSVVPAFRAGKYSTEAVEHGSTYW